MAAVDDGGKLMSSRSIWLVTRPRRHSGGLPAIDSVGGGPDTVMLYRPLNLGCDLLQYISVALALYVTGVSAAIAAVFVVARIRLHLGFRCEGDTFKESAYYKRWTDSSIESLPALREQVRRARERNDTIEPSAALRATVKDLYQAVFS